MLANRLKAVCKTYNVGMQQVQVSTGKKREVVDITDDVMDAVPRSGSGVVTVFVQHTTAAITTADFTADPGTDLDFLDFLDSLVPNIQWRHPHDPSHAPDHLLASLIGPSISVPYQDGKLLLGTWQQIVLVEFDGPRSRSVCITCIATA